MRRIKKVFIFLAVLTALLSLNVYAVDIPIGDSSQVGPSDAAVTIIEFTDYR